MTVGFGLGLSIVDYGTENVDHGIRDLSGGVTLNWKSNRKGRGYQYR